MAILQIKTKGNLSDAFASAQKDPPHIDSFVHSRHTKASAIFVVVMMTCSFATPPWFLCLRPFFFFVVSQTFAVRSPRYYGFPRRFTDEQRWLLEYRCSNLSLHIFIHDFININPMFQNDVPCVRAVVSARASGMVESGVTWSRILWISIPMSQHLVLQKGNKTSSRQTRGKVPILMSPVSLCTSINSQCTAFRL